MGAPRKNDWFHRVITRLPLWHLAYKKAGQCGSAPAYFLESRPIGTTLLSICRGARKTRLWEPTNHLVHSLVGNRAIGGGIFASTGIRLQSHSPACSPTAGRTEF